MQFFGAQKQGDDEQAYSYDQVLCKANIYQSFAVLIANSRREILYVNEEFERVFLYKKNEILGKQTLILNSGLHNNYFYQKIWETVFAEKTFVDHIKSQTKSGSIVRSRLRVISLNAHQKDEAFLFLYDPVENQNDKTEAVFQNNPILEFMKRNSDLIIIKDAAGKWIFANDVVVNLFHLTNINYLGKTDEELSKYAHQLFQNSFDVFVKRDQRCWEHGSTQRQEEQIVQANGSIMYIDMIRIPLFDENQDRKSMMLIGRDVSQYYDKIRSVEAAKKESEIADQNKSTFLATTCHELRTPLNSIMGFADLILYEDNLEEIHEYSRIVNNNGQLMLRLIADLFDISLIDSKQMNIQLAATDIIQIINEVYEIFPVEVHMLKKHDLKFNLNFSQKELVLNTDKLRVKQILTNLLRNSLKFTEQGSISINIAENNDVVHIIIEDTGIGVEQEKLDSIFEMFKQGTNGHDRKISGAGVGLSISRKLAQMLGGNISATSEVGKGSRFVLSLPNQ